jgi:intracellular sulfur oxidation DsrE/DsrF family protein
MKILRHATLAGVFIAVSASAFAAADTATQEFWQTPTVVGVGKVHPLPLAAYQPRPQETYNVVFSITKAANAATEINPSLRHVARFVNLYTSAGVPLSHLGFVAVMDGEATDVTLDDGHYRQKYGVNNPNLDLIRTLRNAGVDVAVSGQAVAERQEQTQWITPEVTLALSGLTTITDLEHQGYVLMPL